MRRREINRVFDSIVDFAEVERFLDTPVKRYSSGMYVRLAFAVAAHLNPDVLILDEVLAVGDINFQKKCLGKMKDITGQGSTVLFVSHNLSAINSFCHRCLLLESGLVVMEAPTKEVSAHYFGISTGLEGEGSEICFASGKEPGDEFAQLINAKLVLRDGSPMKYPSIYDEFGVQMSFRVSSSLASVVPLIHVFSEGQCAFMSMPYALEGLGKGMHVVTMWIPPNLLNAGHYTLQLSALTVNPQVVHFAVDDLMHFYVSEDIHDLSRNGYVHPLAGLVRPRLAWDIDRSISI
jgi:lipopolysaccharide transport system ATP-binding protein